LVGWLAGWLAGSSQGTYIHRNQDWLDLRLDVGWTKIQPTSRLDLRLDLRLDKKSSQHPGWIFGWIFGWKKIQPKSSRSPANIKRQMSWLESWLEVGWSLAGLFPASQLPAS